MIVLLSGGLDSAVLLAREARLRPPGQVEAISIDYGQRHARELDAAGDVAAALGVRHAIINLAALAPDLPSALTTPGRPVPEGHYTAPSMAATVVPGRNLILIAIGAALAAARGYTEVAIGCHAGDHPVYPDCRPEFLAAAHEATRLGSGVRIQAPFASLTKARIVAIGADLSAPMGLSWSCYQGGDLHCGRCGTCTERAEAFALAAVPDPTGYADSAYWHTQARA